MKLSRFSSNLILLTLSVFVLVFGIFVFGEEKSDVFWPTTNLKHRLKVPEILPDFISFEPELKNEEKWLRVDLPKMRIQVFGKDRLVSDYQLIKKGNIQNWGGTASGLNQVNYKSEKWFSNTALAFMPWALNIYGKYYIHGEPFFEDGRPLISVNSGGCLQVRAEEMKTVFDQVQKGTKVLVIDKENDQFLYQKKRDVSFPEVSTKNYLVADLGSGQILVKKGVGERKPIFSLKNLMTALVVVENADPEKEAEVDETVVDPENQPIGFEIGRKFKLGELFYPLLLTSSREAERIVTSYFGRVNTLKKMQAKTAMILMPETSFGKESFSSTRDLFYLLRYLSVNQPLILRMTRGLATYPFPKDNFADLENQNIFYQNPEFVGGLAEEQGNGIFAFRLSSKRVSPETSRREIALIILNNQGKEILKADAEKILNWVKEKYFDQ